MNKHFSRKPDSCSRLTAELGWLILGQVLSVGGALVSVRCLTELLPPETYGTLGLALTAAALLQQLWFAPLLATAIRFFASARDAGQLGVFFRTLARLMTITGTPLLLLLAAGVGLLILCEQRGWSALLAFAYGYAVASGANSLLDGMQNAARCRHLAALHSGVSVWLRLGLAAWLVHAFVPSADVVLVGYIGGSALILMSQFATFRHATQPIVPRLTEPANDVASTSFAQMSAYFWPLMAWVAFTWAFSASDRWFLQIFATTEDVGRYLVLYQLGYYPISLLSELVQQWFFPILQAQADQGTNSTRHRQLFVTGRRLILATAGVVAVAVVCASWGHTLVFRFLAAERYREMSSLLPGMVLASGLFAVGQVAGLPLLLAAGSRALAPTKIVTSCLGLILNAVGAWQAGVAGIIVAQIGFSAAYALWTTLLLAQVARRQSSPIAIPESTGNEQQAA